MSYRSGRHFLQIPGPSNVPDRVLRAIDRATMDHRGPEFGEFTLSILERLKTVFKTEGSVITSPTGRSPPTTSPRRSPSTSTRNAKGGASERRFIPS